MRRSRCYNLPTPTGLLLWPKRRACQQRLTEGAVLHLKTIAEGDLPNDPASGYTMGFSSDLLCVPATVPPVSRHVVRWKKPRRYRSPNTPDKSGNFTPNDARYTCTRGVKMKEHSTVHYCTLLYCGPGGAARCNLDTVAPIHVPCSWTTVSISGTEGFSTV